MTCGFALSAAWLVAFALTGASLTVLAPTIVLRIRGKFTVGTFIASVLAVFMVAVATALVSVAPFAGVCPW